MLQAKFPLGQLGVPARKKGPLGSQSGKFLGCDLRTFVMERGKFFEKFTPAFLKGSQGCPNSLLGRVLLLCEKCTRQGRGRRRLTLRKHFGVLNRLPDQHENIGVANNARRRLVIRKSQSQQMFEPQTVITHDTMGLLEIGKLFGIPMRSIGMQRSGAAKIGLF